MKWSTVIARCLRVLVGAGALLLAVGAYALMVQTRPEVAPSQEVRPQARAAVYSAVALPLQRRFHGFGTAEAFDRAQVPARVSATVAQVPEAVVAGAWVAAGAVLAELDRSDFRRQVASAQQTLRELQVQQERLAIEAAGQQERLALETQSLALLRDELARVQRIYDGGAANRQGIDAVQRSVFSAEQALSLVREQVTLIDARHAQLEALRLAQESALAQAQADLERTVIRSPLAGVLEAVLVKSGESVQAGTVVARVVGLETIEVPLHLPAAAAEGVRPGDRVTLTLAHGAERHWEGTVQRLLPTIDPQTRTITAFVRLAQPGASQRLGQAGAEGLLLPGGFVSGEVWAGETTTRVVLPRRSIRGDQVLVVEAGVVRMRRVPVDFSLEAPLPATGLADRQWVALHPDAPLEPGQQVVLNIAATVVDGQRIAVWEERATGEAAEDDGVQ